jgi:hypothetical protein
LLSRLRQELAIEPLRPPAGAPNAGRKQQVRDAETAFSTQLKDIVLQTAAGLSKSDAQTQATNAATSLNSALKKSPSSRSSAEPAMSRARCHR